MPRPEVPLDPDAGVVQRFASELRRLREKAGSPTYRQLARRAHYSPATLAKAAGGRDLPSLAVTLAYVRACGGDHELWETLWRAAAAEIVPGTPDNGASVNQKPDDPAPYMGLTSYSPDDADHFFGREQVLAELLSKLNQHRILAVFGPSGSGKSSLLRAGLLAAVREERVTMLITPGADPESLLRQVLGTCDLEADALLVVDQFEELFTLRHDLAARERFIAMLLLAVHRPGSRIQVVLGVRADFYTHCAAHRELVVALKDSQMLIGPMSTDELRAVITKPAVRFGYSVENALVSRLIGEATGQAGVLPLLSHALLETWRRRRGNTLSLAGYDAAGGIQRAIAQTAEQAYGSLDDEQQHLARLIFLRLITLGEGTDDTKRRVARSELDRGDDAITASVVNILAGARLLTVDRDSVEIAHEALIRGWPRLRGWLSEDREGFRIHRQLTEAAQTWESLDRDPGALYRGHRLRMTTDWASDPDRRANINTLERTFLGISERAARRNARRQRQLITTLATLLVLALAASVVAVWQRQTALDQRQIALVGELIAQSATQAKVQPDASMLLAVEAFRRRPDLAEARNTLLSSQSQYFLSRLSGHTGSVYAVAFSPDGRTLATGGNDKTVRLWDTTSHKQITTLTGHYGEVLGLAFSPDGRTLATSGGDKTVRLWDTTSDKQTHHILSSPINIDSVCDVAFSPDGLTLAAAEISGAVRIWNTVSHKEITKLPGGSSPYLNRVIFSPDGRTLAAIAANGMAGLWDTASYNEITTLVSDAEYINDVAFSPDGRVLAAAEEGGAVRLWDTGTSKQIATLPGHTADLASVAFSPDGRILATARADGTVVLWDMASHKEVATLAGHTAYLTSVAFSPDGRTLATGSVDGSVVLWSMNGQILTSYPVARIDGVAFSPNGRTLVAAGLGTVRWWDTDGHREIATSTGHAEHVTAVNFSPDGRTLATTNSGGTTQLWDAISHEELPMITSRNDVIAATFGPDGRTLATAHGDGTVLLWDIASHKDIATLRYHGRAANGLAFSPDGKTLATTRGPAVRLWNMSTRDEMANLFHAGTVNGVAFSPDSHTLATYTLYGNTVRLWDVASHREIATLSGHTGYVYAMTFSPDGRTIATVGNDRTIRLWDAKSQNEIATLTGHTGTVNAVAFSPDGGTVATGGDDGTVRLWDLDPHRVIVKGCQLIANVTEARWAQFMPERPYHPACS